MKLTRRVFFGAVAAIAVGSVAVTAALPAEQWTNETWEIASAHCGFRRADKELAKSLEGKRLRVRFPANTER